MPHYISLLRYTQKGAENLKKAGDRIDAGKKAFAKLGGKLHAIYLTMGQYDVVTITEFPDDEAAAKATLALGMQGNIHSETLRAFTEDEFRKIVKSLP